MEEMDYKDVVLSQLILKAKMGDSSNFKKLWSLYRPIFEDSYLIIEKKYPEIKYKKMEIFNKLYMMFWDQINKTNVSDLYGFSYEIKINVIRKLIKYVKESLCMPDEKLIKEKEFLSSFKRESEANKKVSYALRSLTVKQLKAIYVHIYCWKFKRECHGILGITRDNFEVRVKGAYKKMTSIIWGVRDQKTKSRKIKEKAFYLPK